MLTNLSVQLLNYHAVTGVLLVLKTALAVAATGWLINQFPSSMKKAVLAPCRIQTGNSQPDSARPTRYR